MGFVSANNMGGIIKHGDTYWIFWGYIDGVDGMRVCRVCSLNIEYLPCLKMGENMGHLNIRIEETLEHGGKK
jgi:hypothetical protein